MRRLRLAGMMLAGAVAAALGLAFASPAGADTLPGNWIQNNGGSGLCLRPVGGSLAQGAAIEQVNCDKNTTLQRWVAFNFSSDLRVFQMRNVACRAVDLQQRQQREMGPRAGLHRVEVPGVRLLEPLSGCAGGVPTGARPNATLPLHQQQLGSDLG